eukprot:836132-Pyramimonas_sp.AAC.3
MILIRRRRAHPATRDDTRRPDPRYITTGRVRFFQDAAAQMAVGAPRAPRHRSAWFLQLRRATLIIKSPGRAQRPPYKP